MVGWLKASDTVWMRYILYILYIRTESYISLFESAFTNPRSIQICNKTFFSFSPASYSLFRVREIDQLIILADAEDVLDYRLSIFAHSRSNLDVQHVFSGLAILGFGNGVC